MAIIIIIVIIAIIIAIVLNVDDDLCRNRDNIR
jgi:hypothetical protein